MTADRVDPTDGPIHRHFGLSYSNYLVLPRTLLQSMPLDWQERAVALLDELAAAFSHIEQPDCYEVTAAREVEYGDLTDEQMERLGITSDDIGDTEEDEGAYYYDRRGDQHYCDERVLLPVEDTVPHYNRGRTFIEPAEAVTSRG